MAAGWRGRRRSAQTRQLIVHLCQRGGKLCHTFALLLDHSGWCLGDKSLVAEFSLRLGDLAGQPVGLLAKTQFFGGKVNFHVQANAGVTHHRYRGGLRSAGPGCLTVKQAHLGQLGQGLQHRC